MRGWTDAVVAAHATATVLPLSAVMVGRARCVRCVPSVETVRALAAVAGVDPAGLLELRTEASRQPYAPIGTAWVSRAVIVETLGESLGESLGGSLDALRHRRRCPGSLPGAGAPGRHARDDGPRPAGRCLACGPSAGG
ncbi:hypothetical protein [Streptomyces scopuliridis]|uniref:hypothetical protein n=1 Tax=Streptomyces scopuliridis TaxID=452529 RepID=UPI003699852C